MLAKACSIRAEPGLFTDGVSLTFHVMTKLMQQAMAAAATLSEEHQDALARHVMEEAKRLAILEGLADVEAGRVVSHDAMKAWAESLGTDTEHPMPTCE